MRSVGYLSLIIFVSVGCDKVPSSPIEPTQVVMEQPVEVDGSVTPIGNDQKEGKQPNTAQEFVDLNFIVTDLCNNTPIIGATVNINQDFGQGSNKLTDGNGFANFSVPKRSTIHRVMIHKAGYEDSSPTGIGVGDYGGTMQIAMIRACLNSN